VESRTASSSQSGAELFNHLDLARRTNFQLNFHRVVGLPQLDLNEYYRLVERFLCSVEFAREHEEHFS